MLAAACMRDRTGIGNAFERVSGIEILPLLHEYAEEKHRAVLKHWDGMLPVVKFMQCDYSSTEAARVLRSADIVFAFATTWDSFDGELTQLSYTLCNTLRPGSLAIIVDKLLPELPSECRKFVRLLQMDGDNDGTGESTVHVYRVEEM